MGKNGDLIYKWVEENYNNNQYDEGKDNYENSDSLEFILVIYFIKISIILLQVNCEILIWK
jgi:hypothetical protein